MDDVIFQPAHWDGLFLIVEFGKVQGSDNQGVEVKERIHYIFLV